MQFLWTGVMLECSVTGRTVQIDLLLQLQQPECEVPTDPPGGGVRLILRRAKRHCIRNFTLHREEH